MFSVTRSLSMGVLVSTVFMNAAGAQEPAQVQKDAWVATALKLFEVDSAGTNGLVPRNNGDAVRSFKALAFEPPELGSGVQAARGLIAVSGTEIWRFYNGTITPTLPPEKLHDAAVEKLQTVTAVAVTDKSPPTILFSGYSRPKRVFEVYELDLVSGVAEMVATSTPQLTDAVYVRAEDAVAGGWFEGGGLLATAGQQVLFFPRNDDYQVDPPPLNLGLKGKVELTSVDLIPQTDILMLATSDRRLLTVDVSSSSLPTNFAGILPRNSACGALKSQRFLVRAVQGGGQASSLVADAACRQVLRYDFSNPLSMNNPQVLVATSSDDLFALAVGEGNSVICTVDPAKPCPLISGAFDAFFNVNGVPNPNLKSELLVLEFPNLCDPRIPATTCIVTPDDDNLVPDDGTLVLTDGSLVLNELLPQAVENALGTTRITIPSYMFGAGYNGRFAAVFVQADAAAAQTSANIELYMDQLVETPLGIEKNLPRNTGIGRLFNQDVAAYAPDDGSLPTVRGGFEATPITVDWRNPMIGSLRGFSAVIYGLQHDTNPPHIREQDGGIPQSTIQLGLTGAPPFGPKCKLEQGNQVFFPQDPSATAKFFVNLAACLFADEEALLKSTTLIPTTALASTARTSLVTSLGQVEDKLIKALSGAGPNTGSEAFQAVLTQLDQFDTLLAATTFASHQIYKSELQVRSKVFRFNLKERTYPSMPTNGF